MEGGSRPGEVQNAAVHGSQPPEPVGDDLVKAEGDLGPMLSADPLWVPGVPMMRISWAGP